MAITDVTNPFSQLTKTAKATADAVANTVVNKKMSLGQEQFLKLMTTQMTHQDPSKPMENGEFLTQIAQFGTVSGIQDLQKSFGDFASSISSSQALQATTLVGRNVMVPGNQALLNIGGQVSGDINLTSSSPNVNLTISDAATGEVVKTLALGTHSAGRVPFVWDGINANGVMASPGVYKLNATAMVDGKNTGMETNVAAQVDSVTMGNGVNGLKVNLTGLDSVDFNKIKQIL